MPTRDYTFRLFSSLSPEPKEPRVTSDRMYDLCRLVFFLLPVFRFPIIITTVVNGLSQSDRRRTWESNAAPADHIVDFVLHTYLRVLLYFYYCF